MSVITMKQLLEAGVHFGHQTRRWNPKMQRYIFGIRNGIHIVDLRLTQQLFNQAYESLVNLVGKGGQVLFVGTKRQAMEVIAEEAERAGMHSVTNRWLGGTLTNFRTIKNTIERMRAIEVMRTDGTFEALVKKERLKLDKEHSKLIKFIGGIKEMGQLPSAVFVVDPNKESIAVAEAKKLGITLIALAFPEHLKARDAELRRMFSSFGFGQGQLDRAIMVILALGIPSLRGGREGKIHLRGV